MAKDRKVTIKEFLETYNKELNILLDNEDGSERSRVYGQSITIHWNGIYCDCGDGAVAYNTIISPIKEAFEDGELDED